jgi:hypothetical protein
MQERGSEGEEVIYLPRLVQPRRLLFTKNCDSVYIPGVTPREHGTYLRYANHGCRCRRCKKAWREYITSRRRRLGVPPRDVSMVRKDIRHTRAAVQRALETGEDARLPEVALTPLGGQILAAIQQRTGRSRDVVFDELLREHGVSELQAG